MGEKSIQKKQYIVEKAGEVFAVRGFKDVTMKDVVEACGISRGGLYLYYASTKELFEAVLAQEAQRTKGSYEAAVQEDSTPGEKMLLYLNICKKELLQKNNLTAATYEYLFANHGENPVKQQAENEKELLEQIITEGVELDWMTCENPKAAAQSIAYTLDGLKVTSETTGVSEQTVDETINYIMGTLGLEIE